MSKRNGDNMRTRGRIVYVLTVLAVVAGVILSGWLVWSAVSTYQRILSRDADDSPYSAQYQAETFPGIEYMNAVLADAPSGFDGWRVSTAQNEMRMLPSNCSSVEGSPALLAQKMASGDGYSVTIQVYGAGQARTQYEKLKDAIVKCSPNNHQTDEMISYDNGVLATYGDTIISIIASNTEQRDELSKVMNERVVSQLMQTGCISLTETTDDAKRSFYYDRNAFTGLIEKQTVTQEVSLLDASIPVVLSGDTSDMNATMSAVFKNPKDDAPMQPSAPLPSGMTTDLPDTPGFPNIAPLPSKPGNTKDIYYQVADTKGPGCGWAWSGQAVPDFDTSAMEKNHEILVKNAKMEIKNNAEQYNTSIITWSKQTATALSFESDWDQYTRKVNDIYKSWTGLNQRRDELKTPWYNYIQGLQTVIDWDNAKAAAAEEWNDTITTCIKTEKEKDNESVTPTPSPSPSGSSTPSDDPSEDPQKEKDNGDTTKNDAKVRMRTDSEITEQCISQTAFPSILTQQRPAIPAKPSIPENTPIPNDWTSDTELLQQINNPPTVELQYKPKEN